MIEELEQKLQTLIDARAPIGFSLGFDLGDTGFLHLDGRANPMAISRDRADVDTLVKMSGEDALALVVGRLNPMQAYMSGRLQVQGDLSRALQLAQLFS